MATPTPVSVSSSSSSSLISQSLQLSSEEYCAGVDEAGRGPVLGDMVYAIAWMPIIYEAECRSLGVKDSKQVSEDGREKVLAQMDATSWLHYETKTLSAQYISANMLRAQPTNLNQLSHNAALELIGRVAERCNLKYVYVDTVGDPQRYQKYLAAIFPNIQFVVCAKADSIYPIVSAASIAAKVTRDTNLKQYQPPETGVTVDADTGSGYPGDPVTQRWLKRHFHPLFGFPSLVRFSWSTAKKMIDAAAIEVDWHDDPPSEGKHAIIVDDGQKIDSFFSTEPDSIAPSSSRKRSQYFSDNGLSTRVKFSSSV